MAAPAGGGGPVVLRLALIGLLAGCARPLHQRVSPPPLLPMTGAAALAPAEARAAYVRACLARARGDLDAARVYAAEAVRLDPQGAAPAALLAELALW